MDKLIYSIALALASSVFLYSFHILNKNRERRSRAMNSIGIVFFAFLTVGCLYQFNNPNHDTYTVSSTTTQFDRAIIVHDDQGCAFVLAHNVVEDLSKEATLNATPQTIDVYGRVRRVPGEDINTCKRK